MSTALNVDVSPWCVHQPSASKCVRGRGLAPEQKHKHTQSLSHIHKTPIIFLLTFCPSLSFFLSFLVNLFYS